MKRVLYVAVILLLFVCPSLAANLTIHLTGEDTFSANQVIFEGNTLVAEHAFGRLSFPLDKLDYITWGEVTPVAQMSQRIIFADGNTVTGAVKSIRGDEVTLQMPYGVLVVTNTSYLKAAGFRLPTPVPQEDARSFQYILSNGTIFEGKLSHMVDQTLVIDSPFGLLQIPLHTVAQFQAQPMSNTAPPSSVEFSNGDRFSGVLKDVRPNGWLFDVNQGQLFVDKPRLISRVTVAGGTGAGTGPIANTPQPAPVSTPKPVPAPAPVPTTNEWIPTPTPTVTPMPAVTPIVTPTSTQTPTQGYPAQTSAPGPTSTPMSSTGLTQNGPILEPIQPPTGGVTAGKGTAEGRKAGELAGRQHGSYALPWSFTWGFVGGLPGAAVSSYYYGTRTPQPSRAVQAILTTESREYRTAFTAAYSSAAKSRMVTQSIFGGLAGYGLSYVLFGGVLDSEQTGVNLFTISF